MSIDSQAADNPLRVPCDDGDVPGADVGGDDFDFRGVGADFELAQFDRLIEPGDAAADADRSWSSTGGAGSGGGASLRRESGGSAAPAASPQRNDHSGSSGPPARREICGISASPSRRRSSSGSIPAGRSGGSVGRAFAQSPSKPHGGSPDVSLPSIPAVLLDPPTTTPTGPRTPSEFGSGAVSPLLTEAVPASGSPATDPQFDAADTPGFFAPWNRPLDAAA